MRSPRRTLGAAVLGFEALVACFAALVAKDLSGLGPGTALAAGLALAAACVLAAGAMGRPGGVAVGWLVQAALVATGIWVPAMLLVGPVFAVLWWWALHAGAAIERDRALVARHAEAGTAREAD